MYKQGLITKTRYKEAKNRSGALLDKIVDYGNCLQAKEDYHKMAELKKESA